MTGPLQDEVMSQAKGDDIEKSVFVLTHEDSLKYSKGYRDFMEKYPEVGKHVETLFMENRSIGRHAGGVIIAPDDVLEKDNAYHWRERRASNTLDRRYEL